MAGEDQVGVATGMYYTPVGGDIMFVEASVMRGKGELLLTGQLGDVMKESARAALTYAKSHPECSAFPKGRSSIRHSRARARGRDSQGWALRRRDDGDCAGLGALAPAGPPRHCDDGGDHPAWPGPADRRVKEKVLGAVRRGSTP